MVNLLVLFFFVSYHPDWNYCSFFMFFNVLETDDILYQLTWYPIDLKLNFKVCCLFNISNWTIYIRVSSLEGNAGFLGRWKRKLLYDFDGSCLPGISVKFAMFWHVTWFFRLSQQISSNHVINICALYNFLCQVVWCYFGFSSTLHIGDRQCFQLFWFRVPQSDVTWHPNDVTI